MTWPYVSRRAYDLVLHDKERLVAQVDKLIDDLTRQRRFESGMAETPRAERKPLEPMPFKFSQWFKAAWTNASIQRMQRSQAYRRYARGESWDDIEADMTHEDEGLNLAEGDGLPETDVDTDA